MNIVQVLRGTHYRFCQRRLCTMPFFLLILQTCLVQGQYAFVIYDSRRKQVLAARDPSGSVPLYIAFGDEGSVSFTSSLVAVPLCADGFDEVGNFAGMQ